MYTLLRNGQLRRHLLPEGGSLMASLFIAEVFYKFHSFTLECLGFLATWFAVSFVTSLAQRCWAARTKVRA
jgi:hypothetical protein